jgi:hypothetical protein
MYALLLFLEEWRLTAARTASVREIDASCPASGGDPFETSPEIITVNGEEMVVHPAFAGAEGRYEDWIYLEMLQREWERPVAEFERFSHFAAAERPSARAACS